MSYKQALEKIAQPTYGLQSIQEDYPDDTKDYYKSLSSYYSTLVFRYQQIARTALQEGNKNEE
jgi:hypothetical protein